MSGLIRLIVFATCALIGYRRGYQSGYRLGVSDLRDSVVKEFDRMNGRL